MPDFTQHHGMNNSLLAFEMAIDMRSDNAHFAGDILDPGTGDAPALEAARGGVDDRIRRTLLCGRRLASAGLPLLCAAAKARSEEHTSELQSLMRISYAVFCLKKKNNTH